MPSWRTPSSSPTSSGPAPASSRRSSSSRSSAGPIARAFRGAGPPVRGSADTIEPGAGATAMNVKVGGMLRLLRATGPHLTRGSRIVALSGYLGAEPNGDELGPGVVNAALQNL